MTRIVEAAQTRFGRPVQKVTAPGGEGRSSFRLHFGDMDVIATLRPTVRRTHLEAFVLERLRLHSDDLPKCLGVVGEVLFQSDVGRRRLNQEIVRHADSSQLDLAAQAVAAIFRLQSAARRTEFQHMLPVLGDSNAWVTNLVEGVDTLQPYSMGIDNRFDRAAAAERLANPGRQFVKWDCRSGNAALDRAGRLRCFDFEYSGLRHGAEDFAWLIGDEAWPIAPDKMVDVMIDAFDPGCGYRIDDYLDYLSVYLTFHCVQRFKLIVKEARKRGWLSKERVRKYDDAGVHPEFAMQICRVGAYFAAQSPITAPLTRNFDGAVDSFEAILRDGRSLKSA
ncbi:phosphotransferase [Ruegeria pomeroyi]|uniref:Aminoglycoside phosphotransferase family protein n=1 Tax=Ruegeria alba TaxID=2916756 RepID=A0ABS9NWA5_9RHOB|nr:phosphotransferase [Ruegeria alba]MCE8512872.1 phosphotransferase [Ruegeria pomeroyi]MCE8521788.1 phosphotransferase [Ruegeria pomeroyi]MCE8526396.1 phosphotransferase [Ruegeria pomeroyi]MCE8529664.1 phosphotransferase [Ruegeria pomeroyi]MCE8534408.1 phosphotransferase [Ruegeria pomeroyi]